MPVEPQVFLCYGRPDMELAHAIACELWRNRIECYNYLAKPVEDRLGTELPHEAYVLTARMFAAIIAPDTVWRELVVAEILLAHRMALLSEGRCKRVYISTPGTIAGLPVPPPDHLIDRTQVSGSQMIAAELMGLMDPELVQRCQEAWEINRSLYPDAWQALAAKYGTISRPTVPPPPALLAVVLGDSTVRTYLDEDIGRISAAQNRWQFLSFMADIVTYADSSSAQTLRDAAKWQGRPNPQLIIVAQDVAPKQYAPDEHVEAVSQVLRSMARIINCLGQVRCGDAYDIARRYTWPRTRRLIYCGIYGCSLSSGAYDINNAIRSELSRPES